MQFSPLNYSKLHFFPILAHILKKLPNTYLTHPHNSCKNGLFVAREMILCSLNYTFFFTKENLNEVSVSSVYHILSLCSYLYNIDSNLVLNKEVQKMNWVSVYGCSSNTKGSCTSRTTVLPQMMHRLIAIEA